MARLPMPFSNPATYKGHSGIDFPQPRGTLVRASGPGVMGLRNTTPRGGITAWVDYDGQPGVAYAHLDNYDHTPARGKRIHEGDVIAAVGMSGFTTGPHLHSEVYGRATTDGYWTVFDPTRWVGQGGGSGGGGNVVPFPPDVLEPIITELENEHMILLEITDNADGNGKAPGWWLLNTTTGNVISTMDGLLAGTWITVWGDARKVSRQAALNAQDAVRKTA